MTIICCICGEPIANDDMINRLWLHEINCPMPLTGEYECDLECHRECYPGHEAEYADWNVDDEAIMIACPRCAAEQEDFDGFGVVHCEACGYCTHPSATGGVCGICGEATG